MLQESKADVEAGADGDVAQLNPNNKTCYEPVLAKVQPVVSKVQPAIEHTTEKISEFFDDDENEVMTEQAVTGEMQEKTILRVTPTVFGAAVVGMVIGSVIAGPFLGLAIAGGAGYARLVYCKQTLFCCL